MQLIGMLDSPYVRRVAVTLHQLGLPFTHQPLSVFGDFEAFSRINPVVKAPTLVCDDGTVLMDSDLIIDHLEAVAGRRLMPAELRAQQRALRCLGLALAACEKTVQVVYELRLRPADKQHAPWMQRVLLQLTAAYADLEADWAARAAPAAPEDWQQDAITSAVAWHFTQALLQPEVLPAAVTPKACPCLAALSAQAEQLPSFLAAPFD
jgi:glutathione S-transferase